MSDFHEPWTEEWEEIEEESAVRPFVMSMGRTHITGPPVFPETMVMARPLALSGVDLLSFEHQRITRAAVGSTAVAELAAGLGIPLGTAMVIISDMLQERLLTASVSVHTADLNILGRIRDRLERIGSE
jgi:Protein of unknown function (DUF742)